MKVFFIKRPRPVFARLLYRLMFVLCVCGCIKFVIHREKAGLFYELFDKH